MPYSRRVCLLIPVFVLAACGEEQPSTAPTSPTAGGPAYNHTAGHRVVTSLADPGVGPCTPSNCTLRMAIRDPASTEVTFAPGLSGAITLAKPADGGGTLVIDRSITVTGPSGGIVIRRRGTDPAFRIFRIVSGTTSLRNLTIRNGRADPGGGIINFGTLRLANVTLAGNATNGIDNHGTLTIRNSTVVDNEGSGIVNHNNEKLTIANSTVARNAFQGILNDGGTLTLETSTVSGNSSGGVWAVRGVSTLTNARIMGNSTPLVGGGIFLGNGTLTLRNSTVAGNSAIRGGGVANRDGGRFTITNSTISNNTADVGGGILNEVQVRVSARITITNSTISGNSAGSGGGIWNEGSAGDAVVSLVNSTVVRNSAIHEGGGVVSFFDAGFAGLVNTLVAQNSASIGPDISSSGGEAVSARFSLIGDGNGSGLGNTDGNQVGNVSPNSGPIDPRIGPLTDNGGPTRTHSLLADSPAIDAASAADCPATDQRGEERPSGGGCDIGSYERQ